MRTPIDKAPPIETDTAAEIHEVLPSQIMAISPFVDRLISVVKPFIESSGAVDGTWLDTEILDIEIAVREALANAIIHGNRQDPQKSVHVSLIFRMDGEVSLTIRDEGYGFDTFAVADPTARDKPMLKHGRGIHMMRALMDEVKFDRDGTVVRMRKSLRKRA
jgi:anti-sigma regulatory factor (Ser/Thr protein kinase)